MLGPIEQRFCWGLSSSAIIQLLPPPVLSKHHVKRLCEWAKGQLELNKQLLTQLTNEWINGKLTQPFLLTWQSWNYEKRNSQHRRARWLSSYEHWLLFQRIGVQFPTHKKHCTSICNASFWGSDAFFLASTDTRHTYNARKYLQVKQPYTLKTGGIKMARTVYLQNSVSENTRTHI